MSAQLQSDALGRLQTYRRLDARNRLVGVLRIGVPLLGALVLILMMAQIYISSLGARFSIGRVSVARDSVEIEAPEYAGLLDDGSAYRVWARTAKAALGAPDQIDLSQAALTLDRPDGVTMQANAPLARLDTTRQLVFMDTIARVEDSTGTTGVFRQSVFDWQAQVLTANGPVRIDYNDGATVDAEGLVYDSQAQVWTFTNATVTLPDTPGTDSPQGETP